MAIDPKITGEELGELRFEFFEEGSIDSDKKFNSSVKNLLVLIKDFYGADSAAVYWFNKSKQGFKLLAVSDDDGRVGSYRERFLLGNDNVSTVCLTKKAGIFNYVSGKEEIAHHAGESSAKSIIANPLLIDDEVIAVVLCESKTLNFFGTPNIYTLQVFSGCITNYINYFSLNEDFDFTGRLLGILASGKFRSNEDIFNAIRSVFEKYIAFENFYFALKIGDEFKIVNSFTSNGAEVLYDGVIEKETTAYNSAVSRKIEVRNIDGRNKDVFRFSKSERKISNLWFCCLPVVFDEECEALAAFDAKSNAHMTQKILSRIYKQMIPFYLLLRVRNNKDADEDRFPGKNSFLTGLDSGINRCRLFNENNLYCIYFAVDNSDLLTGEDKIEELLADFLLEKLPGQNLVYKIGVNKYAMIADVSSGEKVFLEIEKIRKSLSGKIYNIEGKDISFTASFAIKRFEDLSASRDYFLEELDSLLELAKKEGGDAVKI